MKKRRHQLLFDPEFAAYFGWGKSRWSRPRSVSDVFCRINNRPRRCNANHFAAAGYPMAVLSRGHNWQAVHRWCEQQFRNPKGITYSWTGEKFWFQTEADRDLFIAKWGNQ
ncbi:hypothetical protein [Mesorhizobium sp. M7A.F.Ca.CA.002.12.1.1]|uniref:hypothetical protein n=1 Tax=Mesorhizobium sp. M7A.F.Ca.CA.002.12.1.1 TaxID=2496735 RepID=UPI000FCBF7C1|nr:hypothetical protein [Mesorhizobium sp. M7A.F.Ca.CA.002.12.1.1]RUX60197.1 hypothetical protein EN989_11325 [Mesorhizobium sp. M7A.F.Ca.CA.002.12.1.1]